MDYIMAIGTFTLMFAGGITGSLPLFLIGALILVLYIKGV